MIDRSRRRGRIAMQAKTPASLIKPPYTAHGRTDANGQDAIRPRADTHDHHHPALGDPCADFARADAR